MSGGEVVSSITRRSVSRTTASRSRIPAMKPCQSPSRPIRWSSTISATARMAACRSSLTAAFTSSSRPTASSPNATVLATAAVSRMAVRQGSACQAIRSDKPSARLAGTLVYGRSSVMNGCLLVPARLRLEHPGVGAALADQFLVRALLDHRAAV